MTVNLPLIPLLQTEDNLSRHDPLIRVLEVHVRVEAEGGGVLEEVCGDGDVVDGVHHVLAGLVDAEEGEAVEDAGVDFFAAVGDDADDDLGESGVRGRVAEGGREAPSPRLWGPRFASFCGSRGVGCSS